MATLIAPAPLAARAPAPRARWAGRIVTGVTLVFLAFDAVVKFVPVPGAAAATAQLGWSPAQAPVLGAIALLCLVLYAVPRTAVLGAVLWTGYLGGAVATHLRVGNPLLTHTLFPVYVGALVWGALALRDPRVRALFAPR
ncbi:MAG TPA: DoxX family protein [Gemmatirosa sp.]